MLLQAKFNQIDSQIASVELQIKKLQDQLSSLQVWKQELLSVEQACESAISQVSTALLMLNQVDPSEVPTFKAAVDATFATDTPQLPAQPDTEPAVEPTPEPSPEPTEPAITVEVEAVAETNGHNPTPAQEVVEQPENGFLSPETLNELTIQSIRKLATKKGVDSRSRKRWEIAQMLAGKVTQIDIDNLN
jgi:hypothetical protein